MFHGVLSKSSRFLEKKATGKERHEKGGRSQLRVGYNGRGHDHNEESERQRKGDENILDEGRKILLLNTLLKIGHLLLEKLLFSFCLFATMFNKSKRKKQEH